MDTTPPRRMTRSPSCPFCGSGRLERISDAEDAPELLCAVCGSIVASPARASFLARVATRRRRFGLWSLIRLAGGSIVRMQRFGVVVASTAAAAPLEPPDGVEIGLFRDDDVDGLARFVPRRQLERRLARGEHGLVARIEGRPVGCVWLAAEPRVRRSPVPIRLGPGEIYADGLKVSRAERSRGIGRALSSARVGLARRLGYDVVVSHIGTSNLPARRVHEVQGFARREEVVLVRLPGRRLIALRLRGSRSRAETGVRAG